MNRGAEQSGVVGTSLRSRAELAEQSGHIRLLIAAGIAVSDPTEIPVGVSHLVRAASEILVMSPSLVGPLHWLTGEVDAAEHVADERLATVVEEVHSSSTARVEAVRGDELLRTAFDDAVRNFRPDHILIIVGTYDFKEWHQQRVLEHLVRDVGLPITILPIPT